MDTSRTAIRSAKLLVRKGKLFIEMQAELIIPLRLETIAHYAGDKVKLCRREQQALSGILKGWGNKELANDMGIAERTAKYWVSRLLQKYKVKSREGLAAIFTTVRT